MFIYQNNEQKCFQKNMKRIEAQHYFSKRFKKMYNTLSDEVTYYIVLYFKNGIDQILIRHKNTDAKTMKSKYSINKQANTQSSTYYCDINSKFGSILCLTYEDINRNKFLKEKKEQYTMQDIMYLRHLLTGKIELIQDSLERLTTHYPEIPKSTLDNIHSQVVFFKKELTIFDSYLKIIQM